MCYKDEGFYKIGGDYLTVAMGVIDLTSIILIISGNLFIILAILRPKRSQKASSAFSTNVSSRFVLSLSLADLCVGFSLIYYLSFVYFCSVSDTLSKFKYMCVSRFVLMIQSHMTAGYSLVALSIDRYYAVVHALRYNEIMNNRKTALLIGAVWVNGLVTSATLLVWNNWSPHKKCDTQLVIPRWFYYYVPMFSHLFVLIFITGVHWKIHREAVASSKKQEPLKWGGSLVSRSFVRAKSGRVLLAVVLCYIVCWTPITLVVLIRTTSNCQSNVLDLMFHLTFSLTNLNYVVNPFVYSWKTFSVKTAMLRVVRVCKGSLGVKVKEERWSRYSETFV